MEVWLAFALLDGQGRDRMLLRFRYWIRGDAVESMLSFGVGMEATPLQRFLQHLARDPVLQVKVQAAVTADEVALLAQELGYTVSGSDLLMLSGHSVGGVRVTRIDHPGEYPGRYY